MTNINFRVDKGQVADITVGNLTDDIDDGYILQRAMNDPEDGCELIYADYAPDGCAVDLIAMYNPLTIKVPGRYRLVPLASLSPDTVVDISYR